MLAIASKIKCKRNFSNTPLTFKRTLHISHQESLTGSRHSTYISSVHLLQGVPLEKYLWLKHNIFVSIKAKCFWEHFQLSYCGFLCAGCAAFLTHFGHIGFSNSRLDIHCISQCYSQQFLTFFKLNTLYTNKYRLSSKKPR